MVVDHHREVVRGEAVGLEDHLILDRVRLPLDATVHQIVDPEGALVRNLEAHRVQLALGPEGGLRRRDGAAMTVVLRELVPRFLLTAHLREPLSRAKAVVRRPLLHELARVLLVKRKPLGLDVWRVRAAFARSFVPGDAEPVQPVVDRLDGGCDEPLLISIFDAQDERAALLPSEEVVVEERAHAPDMKLAGRRRREAQTSVHGDASLGRYS